MALSAADGKTVTDRWEYSSYGMVSNRWSKSGITPSSTPFRFNGAFGIATVGPQLLNMRARWYHPGLMRFLSEDPIGFGGGMNWYAFVEGDPVMGVDPFGLFKAGEFVAGLGYFVAGTVGAIILDGAEVGSGGFATPIVAAGAVGVAGFYAKGGMAMAAAFAPETPTSAQLSGYASKIPTSPLEFGGLVSDSIGFSQNAQTYASYVDIARGATKVVTSTYGIFKSGQRIDWSTVGTVTRATGFVQTDAASLAKAGRVAYEAARNEMLSATFFFGIDVMSATNQPSPARSAGQSSVGVTGNVLLK